MSYLAGFPGNKLVTYIYIVQSFFNFPCYLLFILIIVIKIHHRHTLVFGLLKVVRLYSKPFYCVGVNGKGFVDRRIVAFKCPVAVNVVLIFFYHLLQIRLRRFRKSPVGIYFVYVHRPSFAEVGGAEEEGVSSRFLKESIARINITIASETMFVKIYFAETFGSNAYVRKVLGKLHLHIFLIHDLV